MKWTVETLNEIVDAEVVSLPADMKARLTHIAKLIEEMGIERVGEPHVKHLNDHVWEMRLKGRSGISRTLYSEEQIDGAHYGIAQEMDEGAEIPQGIRGS